MSEQDIFDTLRTSIIKNTLKEIYKSYTIKDTLGTKISEENLLNILTNKNKCKNMNNKMIQCKNNTINDSDFCEKHYINKFSQNYVKKDNNITIYQETDSDTEYIQMLDKKLIKDSFYYIDNKYNCFYDSDFNKVGIIQDNDFIFTTNPFLFDQW
jgi:hypothetical protein